MFARRAFSTSRSAIAPASARLIARASSRFARSAALCADVTPERADR
jgi:hypothetical protein